MITKLSPNFKTDRKGYKVKAIVNHVTEGTLQSGLDWIANPKSQVSYHNLVAADGTIYELVKWEHVAWHSGVVIKPTWKGIVAGVNPNLYTVGFAMAGMADDVPPLKQLIGLAALNAKACKQFGLEPTPETIVFHREIQGEKTCPGMHMEKEGFLFLVRYIYEVQDWYDILN